MVEAKHNNNEEEMARGVCEAEVERQSENPAALDETVVCEPKGRWQSELIVASFAGPASETWFGSPCERNRTRQRS